MAKTKLRKYQYEGAKQIREFKGRALLADEMGLGKSLQALFWCYKTTKARPVLIICPASLKLNWEREASKHLGMRSEVLSGRKPHKGVLNSTAPFFVINYDIVRDWMPVLKKLKAKAVILDEVHFIKDRSTKRYKAIRELCRPVKKLIGLSGTPLTNRPAELWPTLNLLRPDLYKSFFKFGMEYCGARKRPWGWEFKGARKLDELHAGLIENVMIRRLKEDVLKELPAKARHVVPVRLSSYSEYNQAKNDFLHWLAKHDRTKLEKAAKAQALVKMGYLLRFVAELKMPYIYDWIDNFLEESDRKLVIMGIHKKVLKPILQRYKSQAVLVDGSVSGHARQEAVDSFQNLKRVRLFVGNIQSAGTGITLTAASDLLFVEFPWVPAELTQAEDRIHRIGQEGSACIHYLTTKETVEEHLCRVLQTKQKVLSAALDGIKSATDFDVFNTVLKKL